MLMFFYTVSILWCGCETNLKVNSWLSIVYDKCNKGFSSMR